MTYPSIYNLNGFEDRDAYLDSLRDEYGTEAVDMASSVLPESEDFDGLITMLEDMADSDDWF
jgi:hypothetical protein